MMPPLRGSVPDREPGTDEGAVLHSVDDRGGVVADRDAALAALVDEGGVAGFGTVAAGLVPRHQVHRGGGWHTTRCRIGGVDAAPVQRGDVVSPWRLPHG